MNTLEIKESLLNLRSELKGIISGGEVEKRELKEEELSRMAEIRNEIQTLEGELAKKEEENRKNNIEIKNKEMKEIRLFDLVKAVADGNVSDEQRAFVKNGNTIQYHSAIQAAVSGQGQENVAEEKKGLDVAIRNASVLNKIGATWFGNAVGDISIPRYAGSNVGWKGEVDAADDGASGFTETVLSPKRLTAYIDISRTFLAQDSNDAEAILIKDLADAIAEKLDETVFGAQSGTTTRPEGLFFDESYTTTGATALSGVSYDNVLDLESKVEEANGTDFVFIMSPKVKYAYKGTQMASGLEMVYEKSELDGYKAISSNSVAQKGIICMDPRDLAVATWSAVEITVDTVSRAVYNEVRIVVNYLVDAKLRGNRIAAEIYA